jgi:hypothetical protein
VQGICIGESGGFLATTSAQYSNGSRDYGPLQDNLTNPSQTQLHEAFDVSKQASSVAFYVANKKKEFLGLPGATTQEEAWRLATLSYNWPWGAEKIAKHEADAYMKAEQAWVVAIGVANVKTPYQWATYYINSKVMYVTNWSVT